MKTYLLAAVAALMLGYAGCSKEPAHPKPGGQISADSLVAMLRADSTVEARGHWLIDSTTSHVDDSHTVRLMLFGSPDFHGWPSESSTPILQLRCKEGSIEAYVATELTPAVEQNGSFYDDTFTMDQATARVRFDKKPAQRVRMDKSTDEKALFFPHAARTISQLAVSESLYFEFTPYNSSPTWTVFHLDSLKNVLPLLRESYARAHHGRKAPI